MRRNGARTEKIFAVENLVSRCGKNRARDPDERRRAGVRGGPWLRYREIRRWGVSFALALKKRKKRAPAAVRSGARGVDCCRLIGLRARAPSIKDDREVGSVDNAVVIHVSDCVVCPPEPKDKRQVGAVDYAIAVDISRAII